MSTPQTQTPAAKNSDKKAPPPVSDAKAPTPAVKTDAPPVTATTPAVTEGVPVSDTDAEPKERQKVYIIVGEVHEFKNPAEAEKYLNKDPAAPKENYTVIKGKKVERKAKVSLR